MKVNKTIALIELGCVTLEKHSDRDVWELIIWDDKDNHKQGWSTLTLWGEDDINDVINLFNQIQIKP